MKTIINKTYQFCIIILIGCLINSCKDDYLEFDPVVAPGGREAMDVIRREKVDIVLSDLYMPEMDGIELLKRVKAENKNIVFLMITAHPTIETAVDAIKKGAYDFLRKPCDIEKLVQAVEEAATRKRMKES